MRRRTHGTGFSLLELMVVIALMSVVTTIGLGVFIRVSDLWGETVKRTDLHTDASRIFERMRDDFDHVVSARLSGVPLTGEERLDAKNRYKLVQLESDRIVLPVEQAAGPDTPQVQRVGVQYQIDRSGPAPVLVRTVGELGASPPAGARMEIAEGVLSLRFEYHDGAEWRAEWHEALLPEAVRVSMVLQDSERAWEQIARKAVYTIRVD